MKITQPKIHSNIILNKVLLERLESINWLEHIGDSDKLNVNMEVSFIHSWPEAITQYNRIEWENTSLEARNVLTRYLFFNHRDRYNKDWNSMIITAKRFLDKDVFPRIAKVQQSNSLDKKFVDGIHWNILGIVAEDYYHDCDPPVSFFHELLTIYESGHLPCGWVGGDWPKGKLIVF